MSRKHFEAIARALLDTRPIPELGAYAFGSWVKTVRAVADALNDMAGLDVNGNRRFDRDRFYAAAGLDPKGESR